MVLTISQIPGKGIGVVTTEPISAGDVVLLEKHLLVYPQASSIPFVCSFCLHSLHGSTGLPCSACNNARFCNERCASSASSDAASHCSLVCRALTACNLAGLSDEQQTALHFLIRACSLLHASMNGDSKAAARFNQLAELAGRGSTVPEQRLTEARHITHELHGRVCHALNISGANTAPIDLNTVFSLLERDAVNGYGIIAPARKAPNSDPTTAVPCLNGTAIYVTASRINHDCLPNVARVDDFDASNDNMVMKFRALHSLPAGEEVTQSYFPLTWTFVERQKRCNDHYGFACTCPRCKEESTWEMDQTVETGATTEEDDKENEADPVYIHLFLLKYVCALDGCGGTMVPLTGCNNVLECNVCGQKRTEAEFLEEVEREMHANDSL